MKYCINNLILSKTVGFLYGYNSYNKKITLHSVITSNKNIETDVKPKLNSLNMKNVYVNDFLNK